MRNREGLFFRKVRPRQFGSRVFPCRTTQVLTGVLKLVQWRYLGDLTGGAKDLVLQPALTVLPLLPLSLPVLWLGLHGLGNARLHLMVVQAQPGRDTLGDVSCRCTNEISRDFPKCALVLLAPPLGEVFSQFKLLFRRIQVTRR